MVRPRRTNRTERTDECASNESVIQRQAEENPYDIYHCCGIILDENDTSYKRRIFLKYLPELFQKKKNTEWNFSEHTCRCCDLLGPET